MLVVNKTWQHKKTGDKVLILWVSDENVTYQTNTTIKAIVPVKKDLFLTDFEVCV